MTASKGQVNRSGERLRKLLDASPSQHLTEDDLRTHPEDYAVVQEFRRGFAYPMLKTNVGLRQFVRTEKVDGVVTQRMKRLPRVILKLSRMPQTNLARLEDIGGCRVILPGLDELDALRARIELPHNWTPVRPPRDYVREPKSSGYRGVHIVVERDDHRIEVQLRTTNQQAWADEVERLADRYRLPLKDEQGPDEILEWLRMAARGLASVDRGRGVGMGVSETFRQRFSVAQRNAQAWMREYEEQEGAT